MIIDSPTVTAPSISAADFASRTGWESKPEGLCKGDACVPAPDAVLDSGELSVEVLAERLGMPLLRDEATGFMALGPDTVGSGRALSTAVAADLELPDAEGNPFRLSSLHGRKVLLVAWASW